MRKFAANYLISDSGILLKNGIVHADDSGNVIQCFDTKGDLRESELLAFHNGILMAGFEFVKSDEPAPVAENPIDEKISDLDSDRLTIQNFAELAKQVQELFPEMIIPEIMQKLASDLKRQGFIQEKRAGVFLLSGANLPDLKFTPKCRIRKIY